MPMRYRALRWSTLAVAAALAACASAPVASPAGAPPAVRFAQAADWPAQAVGASHDWTALRDPALVALIERGLRANLDLQQAAERIQRARAIAREQDSHRGPAGGLRAHADIRQASATESTGATREARRTERIGLGLDLSWELDLFGRLREQSQAADARVRVSAAEVDALRLSVAAEIARAWYALGGAREQLQITQAVIDNRRRMLELVERRVDAGAAAPLDAARTRSELAAAAADAPTHEGAVAIATHRLAVLLGDQPADATLPVPATVDPMAIRLAVPQPDRWLSARPDVRAAEAALQAQSLDVRAVRAEFMPRVSIGGFLGFVAGSVSGLGAAASASWFAAPAVSLPIFDLPRIEARLAAAEAGQRGALLAYRQRILLAVEEVENALVLVQQGQARLGELQMRAQHAVVAQDLARRRFEAGASDLLEWLDAQRSASQAELGLSAALTQQRQQIVGLLRAFGTQSSPG